MRIAWGVLGALVPLLAGVAQADGARAESGPFPRERNYMSCAGFARYLHYRETGEWLSHKAAITAARAGSCASRVCPSDGPPPPPVELRGGEGLPAGISCAPSPRPFSRGANYMSLAGYRQWQARAGCCE